MLFCCRCGDEISSGERYCSKCGYNKFSEDPQEFTRYQKSADGAVNQPTSQPINRVEGISFVDSDEQVIATIGNGYGVNLLYGNVKKCYVVLTNKRLYLNGTLYAGNGDVLTKESMYQIVDVDEITGSGFIYSRLSKWMIIAGILTIPTIVIGIALIVKAFLDRKTFFFVQYAGGTINLDTRMIGMRNVIDFHAKIRQTKEQLKRSKA